jgi:succinate dehydrogenase / fumarate reductase cytochrome b subunit
MKLVKRPLSPHLQVYKPQLTSVLSITHRGTGVFLSLGALVLTYWLVSLAVSEELFNSFHLHTSFWYGKLFLIGFVFSLYYHLANGIRHLFWDIGLGLEISTTYKSGYFTISISAVLTLATLFVGGVL